jgi:PAS domain S-box-containing protein
MNVDMFSRHIQAINERLVEMYRGASISVQEQSDLLLPSAFKELAITSEELQVAVEELSEQAEELVTLRSQIEAEHQRYKDLFDFMPNAYLVTDTNGKIQEANRAAATLLNVEQWYLMDKLLINFIPIQERPVFRSKLERLNSCDWVQEFSGCLQSRNGELFDASLSVAPVRNSQGSLVSLHWIVRDITDHKRALIAPNSKDYELHQERPKYFYAKGEVIRLEPSQLWLVCHGLVKLTTISESGEEVLVGLVGSGMPFGSGLTSLLTYQAIALSENVQLVCIPLSEIATSPPLAQALLPKISERLQQTEALLAISGRRQVRERLYQLLLLLKQQIGQPVAQGTRLSVRLTHQDLADACCTTRVTITRLLSKLQQEGKIKFDSKHHMLLIDESQQKSG